MKKKINVSKKNVKLAEEKYITKISDKQCDTVFALVDKFIEKYPMVDSTYLLKFVSKIEAAESAVWESIVRQPVV